VKLVFSRISTFHSTSCDVYSAVPEIKKLVITLKSLQICKNLFAILD
jgi:hypothetical protein